MYLFIFFLFDISFKFCSFHSFKIFFLVYLFYLIYTFFLHSTCMALLPFSKYRHICPYIELHITYSLLHIQIPFPTELYNSFATCLQGIPSAIYLTPLVTLSSFLPLPPSSVFSFLQLFTLSLASFFMAQFECTLFGATVCCVSYF